jgi:CubicO group peptidase (beta-lactamase class C family)
MKLKSFYFLILLATLSNLALAESVQRNTVAPKLMAGGYAWLNGINRAILPPDKSPREIPSAKSLTANQKKIVARAQSIADSKSNLSLILVQDGEIIFESYKFPSSVSTPMMSWSMSKSLTAVLIGIQHCKGNIPDLDTPISKYVTELADTGYGSATVRDLLKMSSGTQRPINNAGENRFTAWREIVIDKNTTLESYLREYGGSQKSLFGMIRSGTAYSYKNSDTTALEMVVSATSSKGFVGEFEHEIWNKIGAEGFGIWLQDRKRRTIAYAGFNATPRDWIKLAVFSKDLLTSNNKCIRDYMQKATTYQINTDRPAFTQYGYQTWVANWSGGSSYWWRGYAGQRIAVDPKKDLIMYVGSSSDDYQSQVYELFRDWQRFE